MTTDTRDETFLALEPRLFGIAYRMLGSRSDAEDVVQETWLRWHDTDRQNVRNASAFLTRTVTNLSIDTIRRLETRRRQYPGPWLPDPLVADPAVEASDAESTTNLARTLSIALLAMLERVPPNERATFVLREAFELSFDEIAACLDAKPATCRQWAKRARERLAGIDWDEPAEALERQLLERFAAAIVAVDVDALLELLHPDVEMVSDGGGKVAAATRPLHGIRAVSRFFAGLAARARGRTGGRLVRVNGGWGGLAYLDGKLDAVYTLRVRDGRIGGIYVVRNPEKLDAIATDAGPGQTLV